MQDVYELIDSGRGQKLERFGSYLIVRPSPQAVWEKEKPDLWNTVDAIFERTQGERWRFKKQIPKEWQITIDSLTFLIRPTEFGHLGVFMEQRPLWKKIQTLIDSPFSRSKSTPPNVLNLFAYSGGSTLAAARAGAHVCHLDASKGMVDWARKNSSLSHLSDVPIRWIVDDAMKFLRREIKRGRQYDAIILDPPSFGRGPDGEVFKIEETILELLSLCNSLLSPQPLFVLFSCHTAGFTEETLRYLLEDCFPKKQGRIETGELLLPSPTRSIPNGVWALLNCIPQDKS